MEVSVSRGAPRPGARRLQVEHLAPAGRQGAGQVSLGPERLGEVVHGAEGVRVYRALKVAAKVEHLLL